MAALLKTVVLLALAAALAGAGVLVPAHLGSVDRAVIRHLGEQGGAVGAKLAEAADAAHTGPLHRLTEAMAPTAATVEKYRGRIRQIHERRPFYRLTGGPAPRFIDYLRRTDASVPEAAAPGEAIAPPPVPRLLSRNNRRALADMLAGSGNASVEQLLAVREIDGLVRLHPADDPAGGPYDASILLLALLTEGEHFRPGSAQAIAATARAADRGDESALASLERTAIATLSLGRRLDYRSLANLAAIADTPSDWVRMGGRLRARPEAIHTAYVVLRFSGSPAGVDRYWAEHPGSAEADLRFALREGPAATAHLVEAQKPLHRPPKFAAAVRDAIGHLRPPVFNEITARDNRAALLLRFGLFLCAGFALAFALGAAWRAAPGPRAATVSRLHPAVLARDSLLALVAAVTLWLVFEPAILAPGDAEAARESRPRLEFAVADTLQSLQSPVKAMQELNQITLLVLALFFIVQLVIYMLGLIKIREVSKQPLSASMKLRVLDNEENLFDFGLYVGLGGTVLALILVAIGVVEASLMAAYASTLFGILFTAMLKVLHLRPYRRRLILESGNTAPAESGTGNLMRDIEL